MRKFKLKDPMAEREAKKYQNPIPSRELVLEVLRNEGVPLMAEELAGKLGLRADEDLEAFSRRVRAMERDGQILRNRKNCYCIVNSKDLISGRVIGHPDGFGFLKPDDGDEDLFLSPRQMRALLHGDRAVVRVKGVDRRGRKEAAFVKILERNTHTVVGRLHIDNGVNFVVPDNKRIAQDIMIADAQLGEALDGQIVTVEILVQPSKRKQPIGRIVEILGEHMAPGMEIDVAIRAHELPYQWPTAVSDEIKNLRSIVDPAESAHRTDLRATPLVTIDGEDARDFDDAVYCTRVQKGWKLLVAIADVSHYVSTGTALDVEARNRGNSVYFPERVIPMLPEALSNGLCSLVPNEDRLCLVCELFISDDGRIYKTRFFEAVMRSHARLTYTEVAKILTQNNRSLKKKHHKLLPNLEQLFALYKILRRVREDRGTMDFDTQESRIIFGEGRKIESIVPVVRNDAHKLIEECMLVANTAAARFLQRKKMPLLLRVHDGPSDEKIKDLRVFLGEMGLSLVGGDDPKRSDYMRLMQSIVGRKDAHLIQTVLLRSLSQAVYSGELKGHFGLALDLYCHFTSPIRRYPDLLIHRAIRHCINGKKSPNFDYTQSDLSQLGEQCSVTERRADDATRDAISWLKCEFMLDKLGEEFDGIITAVTSFGFFVELADIFVEGLVHISTLDRDYFHFDPIGHRLDGERSGMSYRLGDSVRIKVARVDLDEKKIDFDLVRARKESKNIRSKRR